MNCKPLHYALFLLCLIVSHTLPAKNKDINKIDEDFIRQHLHTAYYSIDSTASAVVLYENEFNHIAIENGNFTKKKVVHKVVRILKDDALSLGNVTFYFPNNDYKNYITNIRGTTYNLNGNNVVSEKIVKNDLLKKEVTEGVFSASFSMPSVRVGSVIEYSYEEITAQVSELYAWHIQGNYPKLVSIYSIAYPKFVQFTSISHLRHVPKEYKIEEDAEAENDTMGYVQRFYENSLKSYWIRRNVPAYKEENYVVNEENNKERLEMQITAITNFFTDHFNNSWSQLNKDIWKGQKLHKQLYEPSVGFAFELDSLIKPGMTEEQKALAIFKYVRDNYKARKRHYNYWHYADMRLKEVWRTHEGNIDEINALMIAMMVKAGIHASPILLSNTDDISPNKVIPVIDRIDYMACVVDIDGNGLLLDASDKNNPAGILPSFCYNGFSWILGDTGRGIDLYPEALKNKDIFSVKIYNMTDSSAQVEVIQKLGLLHSSIIRKNWAEEKDAEEKKMKEMKGDLPEGLELADIHVENKNKPDTNLIFKCTGTLPIDKAVNTIYMNTNFIKIFNKNPFPAVDRSQAIEFPYRSEHAYYMTVLLPAGMEPDSTLPPAIIKFDSNGIVYRRMMNYTPELRTFTVNTNFAINDTWYGVENYPMLREYFQKMIEDNNQVIVFKKAAK